VQATLAVQPTRFKRKWPASGPCVGMMARSSAETLQAIRAVAAGGAISLAIALRRRQRVAQARSRMAVVR
jgi:hypothetical protein